MLSFRSIEKSIFSTLPISLKFRSSVRNKIIGLLLPKMSTRRSTTRSKSLLGNKKMMTRKNTRKARILNRMILGDRPVRRRRVMELITSKRNTSSTSTRSLPITISNIGVGAGPKAPKIRKPFSKKKCNSRKWCL